MHCRIRDDADTDPDASPSAPWPDPVPTPVPASEASPRDQGYGGHVQTFLPYPDFERSARALDLKRLGKQRVEGIQVIRALTRTDYGWRHHPAVLMWRGHPEALGRYALTCCAVWSELGFADTCAATIGTDLRAAGVTTVRTQAELAAAGRLPTWLGDPDFHRSHQSALLRKDPAHYGPLFPGVPDDLEYVWPTRREQPDPT